VTTFRGAPLSAEGGAGPVTLPAFLRSTVRRHAEREALIYPGPPTPVRWTYRDLEREARRVGRALLAAGLAPGERVALLMGNRPEWVASAFGVALAGGVLVPVNTYLEPPELAAVLAHAEPAVLLMQEGLAGHDYRLAVASLRRGPEAWAPPSLRRVVCLGNGGDDVEAWDSFLRAADEVPESALDARAAGVRPAHDAVVIYTSGTTAAPKGVLHAHRAPALQFRRLARHLALQGEVRAWSAFPLFWTAGFAMAMGATLQVGGCLVLQERFEPGEALALLERERVTTPHAWPHQLAELEEHPAWARTDLSALRHVESFGPFGRHPTVRLAPEAWSPRAAYGLTETFTIVTSTPADAPPAVRDRAQGRPLPGARIRILDERGARLGVGREGEIAVAGPTLMRGYVRVPRAEAFDADGFFRTGDAGWVDEEGFLHWTGRRRELIKTGGATVSPVEVELELLRHPALKAAAAVGLPHPTLGEMVVVVAVPHEGRAVDEEEVRRFLRGRLASYKIPRRVLLVDEAELSLTGSAKIRAEDLRALAAARLAEGGVTPAR
jgi:fatty-acyl-CoA synthase